MGAITLRWSHGESDAALCAEALRTQLSVLRAMQFSPEHPYHKRLVRLTGWPLTTEVMSALQGLPQWPGAELDLSGCTWPLAPAEYTRLASTIPTGFALWEVRGELQALVTSIVCSVTERRRGLGLAPLRLTVPQYKAMGVMGTDECVVSDEPSYSHLYAFERSNRRIEILYYHWS